MSFWKTLFGGKASAEGAAGGAGTKPVEYNGFLIRAAPFKSGEQYQTAGTIEKEVGGVRKEHHFIRADSHASYEDAASFSLMKARQIVDQMGERIFD